jgi:hypothetical protein
MNLFKIVLLTCATGAVLVGATMLGMTRSKTVSVEENGRSVSDFVATYPVETTPSVSAATPPSAMPVANAPSATAAAPTTAGFQGAATVAVSTATAVPQGATAAAAAPTTAAQSLSSSAQSPVAAVSIANLSQAMTIEQAYQSIPHGRTPFVPEQAGGMPPAEAQSIGALFYWSDLAVVERVAQMNALQRGQAFSSENYDVILSQLNALGVPEKLVAPKQLVVAAIQDQKAYFEGPARQSQSVASQDPLIQSSHQKLLSAYGQLMQLYPQASESNKKAMFDRLCALDFI